MPFQVDTRDLRRLADTLDKLGRRGVGEQMRALQDTRRRTLTFVNRDIRDEYAVKLAAVKSGLRATPVASNSFTVEATGDALSIKHFGASRQTKKGVTVLIFKGRARTLLRHAFIVATRGDQVFARVVDPATGRRAGRKPIRRLTGPAVAQMFNKPERIKRADAFVGKRLRGELVRRYRRLLARSARR